ncbi:hypothetical protein ACSQ76_19825 [Roseovarius sp. B08]|uniref:hypothetical protein n=1 Tax=Roseovarius sp. B08 TaxID=3449223 RepID=UPI003EDCA927
MRFDRSASSLGGGHPDGRGRHPILDRAARALVVALCHAGFPDVGGRGRLWRAWAPVLIEAGSANVMPNPARTEATGWR